MAALRDETNYHEGALAEIRQRLTEVEERSEAERSETRPATKMNGAMR